MDKASESKAVLSNEVSVGLDTSINGQLPVSIQGKAKSRIISALDRLGGNLIDFVNPWLEASSAKKRAKTVAEVARIESETDIIEKIAEQKGVSEQSIRQAVEHDVMQAVRNQDKKILLLREAIEDLKQRPLNDEEQAEGADKLNEGFLNRLEKQTETATEAEIREKWAKVLAQEIRKPGTFSPKIMRIIDEIEPRVAEQFQALCKYRIGNCILKCLVGKLDFSIQTGLEEANLIVSSNFIGVAGAFLSGEELLNYKRNQVWYLQSGDLAFSFDKDDRRIASQGEIISFSAKDIDAPKFSVYALTDAGLYLASIANNGEKAFLSYLAKVSEVMSDVEIREYKKEKGKANLIQIWKNGKPFPQKFYGFGAYNFGR